MNPKLFFMNSKIPQYRWRIVLFFLLPLSITLTVSNWIIKTNPRKEFNWTESDYSQVIMAFTALMPQVFCFLVESSIKLGQN
jgi:ACS family hexuronate transporter-like MFS transporter